MKANTAIFFAKDSEQQDQLGKLRQTNQSNQLFTGQWCDHVGFFPDALASHPTPDPGIGDFYRDEANGLAITINARLDNVTELCGILKISVSTGLGVDAAIIVLQAYQKWGKHCPKHLLGDFSFAIIDRHVGQLFAATDYIGLRPLFYVNHDDYFVSSSRIKDLLFYTNKGQLNELAIRDYLISGMTTNGMSFYEHIHLLPAAHTLTISKSGIQLEQYWCAEDITTDASLSNDEYAIRLQQLIQQAVESRVQPYQSNAVSLSGGLDSSIITAMAYRHCQGASKSLYSISSVLSEHHQGPERDEREFIETLRKQYPTEHQYYYSSKAGLFNNMESEFEQLCYPQSDPKYHLHKDMMCDLSDRGVEQVLSGVGGDVFASYSGSQSLGDLLVRGRFLHLFILLKQLIIGEKKPLYQLLASTFKRLFPTRFLRWLRQQKGETLINPLSGIPRSFAQKINFQQALDNNIALHSCKGSTQQILQGYLKPQTINQSIWQCRDVANLQGVELAMPLLDRRLVEFILAVPSEQFIIGGRYRSLMRRAAKNVLPDKIRLRYDKGIFSPDFHHRLLQERDSLLAYLRNNKKSIAWQYMDADYIKNLLNKVERARDREGDPRDYMHIGSRIMLARFIQWQKDRKQR